MVRINGKESGSTGMTVLAYIEKEDYDIKRVAVEINGAILPKSEYGTRTLMDGDAVEIVSFVGGG